MEPPKKIGKGADAVKPVAPKEESAYWTSNQNEVVIYNVLDEERTTVQNHFGVVTATEEIRKDGHHLVVTYGRDGAKSVSIDGQVVPKRSAPK